MAAISMVAICPGDQIHLLQKMLPISQYYISIIPGCTEVPQEPQGCGRWTWGPSSLPDRLNAEEDGAGENKLVYCLPHFPQRKGLK